MMVHFRDTDPRPDESGFDRLTDALRPSPFRPPNPPGYAELVDRANRRAAELYPAPDYASWRGDEQRRAYVAGYVDAALGGDTLRP